jgi:hypothetical protein
VPRPDIQPGDGVTVDQLGLRGKRGRVEDVRLDGTEQIRSDGSHDVRLDDSPMVLKRIPATKLRAVSS